MRPIRKWCIALLYVLAIPPCGADQAAAARVIKLTSAEWPPYTGQALPVQGASTAVVRAALAAKGYQAVVEFFPWRRTVALAAQDASFVGYFPEYASPETTRECLLSAPIGTGPLGFAERADDPVHWESLEDLSRYRIGVVDGYFNTPAFDRRVRENKQAVDAARDDAQNLIKLAAKRISLAVIDRRVFDYLTRHDPRVAQFASRLRFNSNLLEEKRLYVCFQRNAEGALARKILDDGLKRIDVPAVMDAALK